MINKDQLRELVIRPALKEIDMYSEAAEELLMLTCAVESRLGTYIKQYPSGPAMGIYQMEPATYIDIWKNYLRYHKELFDKIRSQFGCYSSNPDKMIYDLRAATVFARLHYRRVPKSLPAADDVDGLAAYWKDHYNTYLGAGTTDKAVNIYNELLK